MCRIFFLFGLVVYCLFSKCITGVEANELQQQKLGNNYDVILVAINVLRPDHLSCYGYHRKTSPAIDKLAKESFVFKNTFSQAGYTLPSMMSIITSLYPESHGVLDVCKDKLSSRISTISEILKIYGFKTAWFTTLDEPHLAIDAGFGRGFDYMDELDRRFNGKEQMLSWIKKNRTETFFIAMNIRNLHSPYYPLSKYKDVFKKGEKGSISADREEFYRTFYYKILDLINTPGSLMYDIFDKETISLIFDKEPVSNNEKLFDRMFWELKVGEIIKLIPPEKQYKLGRTEMLVYNSQIDISNKKNLEYLISLYDACILGIDQELIKPIISTLKELKIYDNTILIITADHGESLGEHNILGHGIRFDGEAIHVPLIIKIPYPKGGREVKELAQSIDIMPTILDLLGIPIPYYAQGKSLLPLMQNKKTIPVHEYIYGQNRKLAYLRSLKWKLIVDRSGIHQDRCDHDRFYNLKEDPKQLHDLRFTKPEAYRKLKRKIKEHMRSLPVYIDKKYSFPEYIDKATQEKIKKTGYW